jgi:hypothetical protein
MSRKAGQAGSTLSTPAVDLTHHPLPLQGWKGGAGGFHLPDKLMPQDAFKIHIAPCDLYVGVADPGHQNPHQGFPFLRLRDRFILNPSERSIEF